jgi:hypothetical protein
LIGHLANEVPILVGRMIDSGLPGDLSHLLMQIPINAMSSKNIWALLNFYYNVSLKEEGY